MPTHRATLSIPVEITVPEGVDPREAFEQVAAELSRRRLNVLVDQHRHYETDGGDVPVSIEQAETSGLVLDVEDRS